MYSPKLFSSIRSSSYRFVRLDQDQEIELSISINFMSSQSTINNQEEEKGANIYTNSTKRRKHYNIYKINNIYSLFSS